MRKLHAALLAAGGLVLAAGAAQAHAGANVQAAPLNVMNVVLPDGSTAQVRYKGDVAPRIVMVPVGVRRAALDDPLARLERVSAMMQARHEAMMRQMAAMQRRAMQQGFAQPGRVVVSGNLPAGSYSYTVVSSTSGNGCTQTVRWNSDGSSQEPRVTRTSAGDCSAVRKHGPAVPVAAPAKPAAPAVPAHVLERQARLPAAST